MDDAPISILNKEGARENLRLLEPQDINRILEVYATVMGIMKDKLK